MLCRFLKTITFAVAFKERDEESGKKEGIDVE